MKHGLCAIIAALGISASYIACAAHSPLRVAIDALTGNARQYLGRTVSVRGCLFNIMPHGEVLAPCGWGDHPQITVTGQSFKFMAPFVAGNKKNPKGSIMCVGGDFVGIVVATPSPWHPKEKLITIYLKSFSDVSLCPA